MLRLKGITGKPTCMRVSVSQYCGNTKYPNPIRKSRKHVPIDILWPRILFYNYKRVVVNRTFDLSRHFWLSYFVSR